MDGFNNEYYFVIEFNNKKVKELNPILHEIIYSIFNNIQEDDVIKCWRNHLDQKSDIILKIGKAIKGISIKMGSRNSVHVETIKQFKDFLKKNHVPPKIINAYLKYHYADGTINNRGNNRISAEAYKKEYQDEIDSINTFFNSKEVLEDAIDRFVLKGNNCDYPISGIIWGTPESFLWIQTDSIKKVLTRKRPYCSSPHFNGLICQPMNRCLNRNKKYEKYRNFVQIKWYSLFDDIIYQMNDTSIKKSIYKDFQADHWV